MKLHKRLKLAIILLIAMLPYMACANDSIRIAKRDSILSEITGAQMPQKSLKILSFGAKGGRRAQSANSKRLRPTSGLYLRSTRPGSAVRTNSPVRLMTPRLRWPAWQTSFSGLPTTMCRWK